MTPNVDPITFFNKANELMVKNSPAAADKEMLEKIAAVNIGPGMEFDTSVLTGDVAENWKTMLTEIRLKLIKEGQKFSKSLVSGTILVNRSEISIQNMLIVERRPQFFYNRKLTRKIFADGRILDSGLKKNFSHTGI